jgi:acetyl esterase/lipase
MHKVFYAIALWITFAVPSLARAENKPAPIQVERDLVYGKGGDQDLMLDLAMPKNGDGPFPVVICIHGGGWTQGKRQDMSKTIETLAGRGFVAVTPTYRLAPDNKFPAQIEDCKAAVRWLRSNADKYKVNSDRIGAIGFSAGAHLACLLGLTTKDDGLEGKGGSADQSSRVQAVVSFFGPTDLTLNDWSEDVEKRILIPFLGDTIKNKPDLYKKVSPVNYVTKEAPPFLFFHGDKDPLVGVKQSKLLAEKLTKAGVSAKLVIVEGEGHGWAGKKLMDNIEEMVNFLNDCGRHPWIPLAKMLACQ